MDLAILVPLAQNASFLLVLSVIFEGVYLFPIRSRIVRLVVIGLLISGICIAIMLIPYTLRPGLVFDTRSILISVTALIFGPIPTIITAVVAIVYRLLMGGIGALPGFLVITSCSLIGLAWRRWLYPKTRKGRLLNVYLMSVIVHVVMLACMLPLPYPNNIDTIRVIALPVLVIYPITATMLSLLLLRQRETQELQKQLKQSEEKFRVLFDEAPIGYQALDSQGRIISVNRQWLEMLGYTTEQAVGRKFGDFVAPEDMGQFRRKFQQFVEQGQIRCEMAMLSAQGNHVHIHIEGKVNPGSGTDDRQFNCILQDITEQYESRESLRASEEKYGRYIRNAPYAVVVIDENGAVVEVNEASARITGYTEAELLTINIMHLVDAGSVDAAQNMFGTLLLKDRLDGELQYRQKNGALRWASVSAVRLAANRLLCFMSDVTEQKTAADKLLYTSTHDDLTGLWNRRSFDADAERLNVPEQLPLSVLIGDINGLKMINDSFGRAEGDRIIIRTGELIGKFCRPGDVMARTGGDEFSVILPKTDNDTAMNLLQSVHTAFAELNRTVTDDSLHIHLALGVSTKDSADEPFTEVLRRAEDSMNQRKLLEDRSSHSSIIATIKATMREKSHETEEHEERIARLARRMGEILGLTQLDLDYMELLAGLHDIGKVGISEHVLNKPGKLNEEEWQEMRRHPEIGERIAMSTSSLAPIAYYILCHHER